MFDQFPSLLIQFNILAHFYNFTLSNNDFIFQSVIYFLNSFYCFYKANTYFFSMHHYNINNWMFFI